MDNITVITLNANDKQIETVSTVDESMLGGMT